MRHLTLGEVVALHRAVIESPAERPDFATLRRLNPRSPSLARRSMAAIFTRP